MSWPDFLVCDLDDQEFMIAVFNAQRQMDAVQVYDQYRKNKPKKG